MVGPQGLARGSDVGDRLGRAVLDGPLGRPLAVDQLIVRHPLRLQKVPHQAVVLGRDPQPVAVHRPEGGGGGVKIVDRLDVDPDIRDRKDQVSLPEAQPAAPQASAPVPQEFAPPPVPQEFTPPPAQAEPALTAEPVRFNGPKHRINREALRQQGMIVPEGAVTALLEEFRIVKRQILQSARERREIVLSHQTATF